MGGRRISIATALVWSIAQLWCAAPACAAEYLVRNLSFGVTTIAFQVGTITFNVSNLNFLSGLIITETATSLEVSLPADVLFDLDKADIRPDAQSPLHEVAQLLREKASGSVTIQGHTDALGTDSYNQTLSERRAAAVKTWLTTREGLSGLSFTTKGSGSQNPVAPNRNPDGSDNPAGRQMNRRVTFVVPR